MNLIYGTLAELQAAASKTAAGVVGMPTDQLSYVVFFDGSNARVIYAPVAGMEPIDYYGRGTSSQETTGISTAILNQLAINPGSALNQGNSDFTAPSNGRVRVAWGGKLRWVTDGGVAPPTAARLTLQLNSVDVPGSRSHEFKLVGDEREVGGTVILQVSQGDKIRCRLYSSGSGNGIQLSGYTLALTHTPDAPA